MKPQETIDFNIRWAWHSISRMYNTEAAKHSLTMSIGYVLLNIDVEKGTPSTKLGPKMGMESRSLTRILKSMEEKGFIERKADENDKRLVRICLTQEGRKRQEISKNVVLAFNHTIYKQIPKAKLKTFFEVIGQINSILETDTVFKTNEVAA